jgi:glycosyltransferase involved in cell wall biosynthesis
MSLINQANIIILIPAKNEAASIREVIVDIRDHFTGEILVINDASTDQTAQIAEQNGAKVLNLPLQLGAWGAMQAGLRYALKHGFEIAITMDADGQHQADSLLDLQMPILANETDVVIGAFPQRGSTARVFAWHLFRLLSGISQEDLTSGFRAYNQQAIKLLASPEATLLDYQDLGVLLLLHTEGLRIQEIPVEMRPRTLGKSRIFSSWWAVANYMFYTLTLCIAKGSFNLSFISRRRFS